MLSVKNLASVEATSEYFKGGYYLESESLSKGGRWWGAGSVVLGLEGQEVNDKDFKRLLTGICPDGTQIGRNYKGEYQHRPGYDLTFSAPKSVSMMALMGEDDRLIVAHKQAVDKALSYIEKNGFHTIRTLTDENGIPEKEKNGKNKTTLENVDKLIIAQFDHATSRENDPQLHTHCVIMNMFPDGDQWRGIRSERIYHLKMLYGAIYRSELALEIQKHGYELRKTHDDGRFEIKDINQEQIDVFSKRRKGILEHLEKIGIKCPTAKEQELAALKTRQSKDLNMSNVELKTSWETQAKSVGLDFIASINKTKSIVFDDNLDKTRVAQEKLTQALHLAANKQSVFTIGNVLKSALGFGLGKIGIDDLVEQQKDVFDKDKVIITQAFTGQATLQETIDKEEKILKYALEHFREKSLDSIKLNKHLQESDFAKFLNEDQARAVKFIIENEKKVCGLQGFAGTGKTTMLKALKSICDPNGIKLMGLSCSGDAVREMINGGNIPSQTIAMFKTLHEHDKLKLPEGPAFIIMDEASKTSNDDMLVVFDILKAHKNINLVVVGDQHQYKSAGAGEPFRLMMDNDAIEYLSLKTLVRQNDKNLKESMAKIIDYLEQYRDKKLLDMCSVDQDAKDIKGFEGIYKAFDSVVKTVSPYVLQINDDVQRANTIVSDYMKLSANERDDVTIIVGTHAERKYINSAVQRLRKQGGELGEFCGRQAVYLPQNLESSRKLDVTNYRVGDAIRFNKGDAAGTFKRGKYYMVREINNDGRSLLLECNGKSFQYEPDKCIVTQDGSTEVFKVETREFYVGDEVRFMRSTDRLNGIDNGTCARIIGMQGDNILMERKGDNKSFVVNINNEKYKHFDLSYVITSMSSQGITKNKVFLAMSSEHSALVNLSSLYVGLTRARNKVKVYANDWHHCVNNIANNAGMALTTKEALNGIKPCVNVGQYISKDHLNVINGKLELMGFEGSNVSPKLEKPYQKMVAKKVQKPIKYVKKEFHQVDRIDVDKLKASLTVSEVEDIAQRCLGPKNSRLSTKSSLAFGKKGSLKVSIDGAKFATWFSFEEGRGGDIISLVQDKLGLTFQESIEYIKGESLGYSSMRVRQKSGLQVIESSSKDESCIIDRKAVSKANDLYKSSKSIKGTLAEHYLLKRGIHQLEVGPDIRFCEKIYEPQSRKEVPAIVYAARRNGNIEAIQAVYLDQDGSKMSLDVSKRTHGRLKHGASVMVNKGKDKSAIFICEGVETALSVRDAMPDYTIISTLSVSNIKNLKLDKNQKIIICADNDGPDSPSFKTYKSILSNLKEKGYDAHISAPSDRYIDGKFIKTDFNDLAQHSGVNELQRQLSTPFLEPRSMSIASQIEQLKSPERDPLNQLALSFSS